MSKYTKVPLTIRQIAGLRVMLKLEAIANLTEGVMEGEKIQSPMHRTAGIVSGCLGTFHTWSILDRPLELALRTYDEETTDKGLDVNLDAVVEVPVFTDALNLYHVVVSSGVYKRAIIDAQKIQDPQFDMVPMRLMEDVAASLEQAFPQAPEAVIKDLPPTVEMDKMTFPVRGGGMVN